LQQIFNSQKGMYPVHLDGQKIVGVSWYRRSMMRNKNALSRAQCKPWDINWFSWCTVENFYSMYEGVYLGMVDAGIAFQLDEDIMYDKHGEKTTNIDESYGHATKYKIIHPEYLLFVDETGCNTNMKENGLAGGQLFVLPVDMGSQEGCNSATTDIHFTVLCFASATGEPVLCAVILKETKRDSGHPTELENGH
jgi:hypothetical protein